ncbi:GNAT family protein [Bacillus carboniphilus]|uniref:GNAT family protein n=1 Tax=Bacillus carboniphilus TaxID=86663 RepID=A0ABN0VWS5_9BACI
MSLFQKAKLMDIKETDLQLILDWRNQESIRKVMYNSDIILLDEHIRWFESLRKSEKAISKIFYYENIPFGVININQIDKTNKKCEWGFYIGNKNAPRGMGTVLGFISLNYIFDDLSMRKVNAEVLSMNEKSISLHRKLGFTQEGLLRKHIIKDKNYIDIYLFGLLQEEWKGKSDYIKSVIKGRYL